MVDEQRIQAAVASMLEAIGADLDKDGLKDTPLRVARMYEELFSGIGIDPVSVLDTVFEEGKRQEEMVIIRDVPFFSMCEHHLLPFFGKAHMGYVPDGKIAGISKLARVLEVVARQPQLQERMTAQIADAIHEVLRPDGVVVVVEAEHMCMSMRGVKKEGSVVVTSATRGKFDKCGIGRGELLELLKGRGS